MLILAIYATCSGNPVNSIIHLPEPEPDSGITLNEAIDARRSVRDFAEGSITLQELARRGKIGILFKHRPGE